MKIQVLVASMNQTDYGLLEKMNIQTDAIIGNQCDRNEVEDFEWNGHKIKYLSFAERGVGLNRNNALMRADADICLFADDDMIYEDDYADKVLKAFEDNPKADVIVFNLREPVPQRYIIKKTSRIGYLNYLRYGTARIAFRLKSVRDNGIYFNQCFGGGTEHSHGEDNLFLTDCLKKKLKIFAVGEYIASLTEERESSWDCGYNDKYIKDQGALYKTISHRWWRLLCLQDAVRKHKTYGRSLCSTYRTMLKGAKS